MSPWEGNEDEKRGFFSVPMVGKVHILIIKTIGVNIMTSQKLENLLNLALNSTEDEREKSLNLNVGYNPIDREWDLIIKYSGNLDRVREIASGVTELQNDMRHPIVESRINIYREFRK